ncbi:TetR/AcrR family transcriptional regulator [Galactobacter caseinivorans]|uniref:TetR/AcrR family transcriptional regulator n=1 Tax=Galactobacter caseinivorans TaxID=2676123 RepID=A0A496PK42_9MICC|nr:TetR/AcrR family transcriptional regulator [Galactobacter caseinivorans]RKW70841.1 TetR/AcrR family transcriptional regulator [Galactobacter caseinivorans]
MAQDLNSPDFDRPLTPRAQEVVAAASQEFALHGFAGATTDAIARRADVSQPYVVRLFGSKERLFLRCARTAHEQVCSVFRDAIATTEQRPVPPIVLGTAYQSMLTKDSVVLQLMVQQHAMGQHPTIGPIVRQWFVDMYSILRHEAAFTEDMARTFVARGMLINTLLSLGLTADDQDSAELLRYLAPEGQRPPTGH